MFQAKKDLPSQSFTTFAQKYLSFIFLCFFPQTAEEMLQNPYRKYVEKYLKTKGLRKTMATLNRLIRGPLRRAKLALERPAGMREAAEAARAFQKQRRAAAAAAAAANSAADDEGNGSNNSGSAAVNEEQPPFHYHPHLQGIIITYAKCLNFIRSVSAWIWFSAMEMLLLADPLDDPLVLVGAGVLQGRVAGDEAVELPAVHFPLYGDKRVHKEFSHCPTYVTVPISAPLCSAWRSKSLRR